MPVADLSGDRVAERLGALEEAYASFPVNQTTLTVSQEAYERTRERCETGLADVYVQLYDDDQVLLVDADDGLVVPSVSPEPGELLEAGTRRAVAEATGVQCRIVDVERVTILGVRDESDPDREPIYRLVTVLAAERTGGAVADGAEWHATMPDAALPTH